MANIQIKSSFSPIAGSRVRRVYDERSGLFLGTITKLENSQGYRVFRLRDGKTRTKRYLSDAFKSIKRQN